jgi:Flp pilus assembly protein TadB
MVLGAIARAAGRSGVMNRQVRDGMLTAAPLVAFPSVTGVIMSTFVAITLYRVVPHLTALEHARLHKVSITEVMPVLDGLALHLSAGLSIPESMKSVGESGQTLAHRQLLDAFRTYELGQDLPTALVELERTDPQWALLSSLLGAAHMSGAPVVASIDSLLEYLREEDQSEISTRIRSLAVKSVLPLGLCFLPAFFLLTVVPLVAQFLGQMSW